MIALWAQTTKNTDWSTGPLACPFVRSFTCLLALLTCLLAPHYSLCLRAPLRSLVRLLAHFAHFLTVGQWMIGWLFILCFFSILANSGFGKARLLDWIVRLGFFQYQPNKRTSIDGCYLNHKTLDKNCFFIQIPGFDWKADRQREVTSLTSSTYMEIMESRQMKSQEEESTFSSS